MNETPQQYTQRLIGNVGSKGSIEVLESTVSTLESLIPLLEKKGFQSKPSPDKWSAAQILAHLAEGEIVLSYRFRRILNSSGEPIEAYDQNSWVGNSGYLQNEPEMMLSLFKALRKTNVLFLKSLTDEQLSRFGIHSERGKESISHLAKMAAGHDINHLRQIEALAKS